MSKYFKNLNLQIKFLLEIINNNNILKTDTILDLGCDKHAPHKCELETLGYTNVYGVDIKPNSNNLNNYIQTDFLNTEFKLNTKAKLIYIFSPCFEEKWWDLDIFLQNVANNLDKDGVFILDLFDYNSLKIGTKQSSIIQKEEKTITANTVRLKDRFVLDYKELRTQDGLLLLNSKGIWRIFEELELSDILAKYGLIIKNKYSDFGLGDGSFDVSEVKSRLVVEVAFRV
jgi:SAM-dependent methyltransferase